MKDRNFVYMRIKELWGQIARVGRKAKSFRKINSRKRIACLLRLEI